jgi:hypothetical protein
VVVIPPSMKLFRVLLADDPARRGRGNGRPGSPAIGGCWDHAGSGTDVGTGRQLLVRARHRAPAKTQAMALGRRCETARDQVFVRRAPHRAR